MTICRELQRSHRNLSFTCQREAVTQERAQFDQREPCVVLALAAIRAVVVRIIDMCERSGLEHMSRGT
jgi:hypothetical protein